MKMTAEDEVDGLPGKDAARGFYAKYEPKEILGRGGCSVVRRCIGERYFFFFSKIKNICYFAIIFYMHTYLYLSYFSP